MLLLYLWLSSLHSHISLLDHRSLEAAAQPSPVPPQPTPSAVSPTAASTRPPPPPISASSAAPLTSLPPSSTVSSSSPAALLSPAAAQQKHSSLQEAQAEIASLQCELQVTRPLSEAKARTNAPAGSARQVETVPKRAGLCFCHSCFGLHAWF